MIIIVNGTEKNVTMTEWDGRQWGCDFFSDVETNHSDYDEMSELEFDVFVSFWIGEVRGYNMGCSTECLGERLVWDGDDSRTYDPAVDTDDDGELALLVDGCIMS